MSSSTVLLKIGTYNIQKCSAKKIESHRKIFYDLINLYDVIFIQEIQTTVNDVDIQKIYDNKTHTHVLSTLVGRNKYKEKYCYIYNKNKIKVIDSYIFDDIKNLNVDCFERDPYIIKFECAKKIIVIIGCHTKPTDSLNECNMLDNVAELLTEKTDHLIILGDLNASGNYVRNDNKLDLHNKNTLFNEITNNKMDTMVSEKSDNAYDRIYCTPKLRNLMACVGVINMEHMFEITNDQVKKLSDHYPLEVTFVL